jgi:hypothetical protein
MRRFLLLLPVLLLALSAACRSGGGGGVTSPSGDAPGGVESSLQAFSTVFQTVSVGLTVAFTQGTEAGAITQYKHTLLCDPEGTSNIEARVSDSAVDGTFFVESNLKDCTGVDGDLTALGTFKRSAGQISFQWTYDGILRSGECDVDLSDLSISSFERGGLAESVVSGTLSATCPGGVRPTTVECAWDQTSVSSEDDLLSACTCSGITC